MDSVQVVANLRSLSYSLQELRATIYRSNNSMQIVKTGRKLLNGAFIAQRQFEVTQNHVLHFFKKSGKTNSSFYALPTMYQNMYMAVLLHFANLVLPYDILQTHVPALEKQHNYALAQVYILAMQQYTQDCECDLMQLVAKHFPQLRHAWFTLFTRYRENCHFSAFADISVIS